MSDFYVIYKDKGFWRVIDETSYINGDFAKCSEQRYIGKTASEVYKSLQVGGNVLAYDNDRLIFWGNYECNK